jgi:exopolysaccharide production protein ExoZ
MSKRQINGSVISSKSEDAPNIPVFGSGDSVNASGRRNDIGAIQYLRAVAALLVVFHHALNQFPEIATRIPIDTGASGVDVFFVISGFVMTYTTRTNEYRPAGFLLRRAVRIIPLYWSMTLFVAALLLVAPTFVRHSKFSFEDLFLSLLFIPHANAGEPDSLSPMVKLGWTLNYEAFFYVVFAAVIALSGLRRTAALATVFFMFIVGADFFHVTAAPVRFWADLLL